MGSDLVEFLSMKVEKLLSHTHEHTNITVTNCSGEYNYNFYSFTRNLVSSFLLYINPGKFRCRAYLSI